MVSQDANAERRARGTIVFDLDGVIYVGSKPIPGASEAIRDLAGHGWQLLFATNNSSKTSASVARLLSEQTRVAVNQASVVTSGTAVATHVVAKGYQTAFVLGPPELSSTIQDAGVSIASHDGAPDVVVVGLDRSLTYSKIDHAAAAIRRGAAFVASNLDATIPTPNGEAPGAGTIVAAVAEASGVVPIACGKPHQVMLDLVTSKIETPHVWMIGDRPDTDIAFAHRGGWRSVLTLSGVTKNPEGLPGHLTPDHVLPSIASLLDLLEKEFARITADEGE